MTSTIWRQIADQHFAAEHACDLAGTMATFHPEATCELQTFFLKMSSRETIKQLHDNLTFINSSFLKFRKTNQWYSDNGICVEWEYTLHGSSEELITTKRVTIFEFSGTRIISKRIFTDGLYTILLGDALGSEFHALPGVENIGRISGAL